jgi:26S proteasome non-ATPase regulatory subunit 9
MKDIEALLPTFYAEQAANSNQSSSNDSNNNSSSSSNHSSSDKSNGKSTSILNTSVFINFIPIAIIDEVFPQSPAALAGIKEGDALIKFADITQQSFEPFKRIAELVGRSLNIPIELVINRKGEIISLSLTPKIWSGRGTLGCHLAPINH